MMNRKRKNKINTLIIILLIVSLGYALLRANLNINGLANIKSMQWDIHWENVSVAEGSVQANKPVISANKKNVTYSFNLKGPGDYYEFTVDAVNNGSRDAMISDIITKFNESESEQEIELPSYIKYSLEYPNGVAVAKNDKIAKKTRKRMKVRIEFDKDSSEKPSGNVEYSGKIDIDFKEADEEAKEPDDTMKPILPGKEVGDGDEPATGDKAIIADPMGEVDEEYIVIEVREENGEKVVDLFARRSLSSYGTLPGSVQFMQYDTEKIKKYYGVNHIDVGCSAEHDEIVFSNDKYWDIDFSPYDDQIHAIDSSGLEYCVRGFECYSQLDLPYVYDENETYSGNYYDVYNDDGSELCKFYTFNKENIPLCLGPDYVFVVGTKPKSFCTKSNINSSCHFEDDNYNGGCVGGGSFYHSLSTTGDILRKYRTNLNIIGINPTSVRLPSLNDLKKVMGALNEDLDDRYQNDCFWLGTLSKDDDVFRYCTGAGSQWYGELSYCSIDNTAHARPVITMKLSDFR